MVKKRGDNMRATLITKIFKQNKSNEEDIFAAILCQTLIEQVKTKKKKKIAYKLQHSLSASVSSADFYDTIQELSENHLPRERIELIIIISRDKATRFQKSSKHIFVIIYHMPYSSTW